METVVDNNNDNDNNNNNNNKVETPSKRPRQAFGARPTGPNPMHVFLEVFVLANRDSPEDFQSSRSVHVSNEGSDAAA